MEATSQRLSLARSAVGVTALLLPLLGAGCVTMQEMTCLVDSKPHAQPCQVVTTWQHELATAPDPTHGGAPVVGFVGRLYLFGSEIKYPNVGDGTVIVDLYDDAPLSQGKPAVLLEVWRFDKDTLKKLERKDAIGWGYTLFLPWGTYRPDIAQVHLRARYDPPNATPLYTDSAPINLGVRSGTTITVTNQRAGKPATAVVAGQEQRPGIALPGAAH